MIQNDDQHIEPVLHKPSLIHIRHPDRATNASQHAFQEESLRQVRLKRDATRCDKSTGFVFDTDKINRWQKWTQQVRHQSKERSRVPRSTSPSRTPGYHVQNIDENSSSIYTWLIMVGLMFPFQQLLAQSSVTLYGVVDMGLSYQSASSKNTQVPLNSSTFGVISGGQSADQIGLRGKEDLGSGTQFNFDLESAYNLGNGTQPGAREQRLFNRQSWLGVQNVSLGYVRVGRQFNFAFDYLHALTPFAATDFARASIGSSFASGGTERLSNTIKFETAPDRGFKAGAGYSFAAQIPSVYRTHTSETPVEQGLTNNYNFPTNDNLRAITAGIQYKDGPWYATGTADMFMPNASTAQDQYKNILSWTLGGYYNFSLVKLSAAYGQTRNGWINTLQTPNAQAGNISFNNLNPFIVFDENISVNSYLLGLTVPLSESSNIFSAIRLIKPSFNMQTSSTLGIDTQSSISIGYTYGFTARTNLYAYTSYARNYAMVEGLSSFNVAVGLRHTF